MEIKIQCPCGQKYKFDVRPVNGRMSHAVQCPVCRADGTDLANAILARDFPAHAAAPGPPVATGASSAHPAGRSARTSGGRPRRNLPLGLLGGVTAGGIGMLGWYFLTQATHAEWGIAAWLVGVVTGFGVRVLAGDRAPVLGVIAGICAALAILGGGLLPVINLADQLGGMPWSTRLQLFKDSVSLLTVLWLVFGVGSAWRIATR